MQKKILFLGKYLYLCIPQYVKLIPYLKEFTNIFLFVKDPLIYISEVHKIELSKYFDYILSLKKLKYKHSQFWKAWIYRKNLIEILYKINPDVIISCSDSSLSDMVIQSWSNKNLVPFIIIQPSFISKKKKRLFKILFKRALALNIFHTYKNLNFWGNEYESSHLFLWSEYFIENPKRENIHLVGNPALDDLFIKFDKERKIKNNVIICTQPIEDNYEINIAEEVIQIYLEAIEENCQLNFFIKLHPREPIGKYDDYFNPDEYSNITILKNENLYDLFKRSDIQISVFSFSSFEAAAMGLPVIIVNPGNKMDFFDYFQEEINIKVTKKGQITNIIKKILTNDYWNEFLVKRKNYFTKILGSLDGDSSKRAADEIKKLLKIKDKNK